MKKLKALVAACLAVTMLAGCGGSGSSNSVTVMSELDIMSMDSALATDGQSFSMIQAIIDGLYGYDKDGKLVPALVEKETVSKDGLTYTFTLKDAKWSNGDAVTANDFVYSWKRIIKSASEYAFFLGGQALNLVNGEKLYKKSDASDKELDTLGVKAIDDKTLEVKLAAPCGFIHELLAFPVLFPINEKFAEEKGDQYALTAENLLSCGAFKVDTWEQKSKINFVKNPDYYDADAVTIDNLTVNLKQDQAAAAVQFDNGELDFCTINSSLVDKYKDSESFKSLDGGFLWYLFVNFTSKDMANLNIRKGLSAAINREDFATNVLKDGSVAAKSFVPAKLATSTDGKDFTEDCGDLIKKNGVDFNLEKAQAYIDAGLKELGKDSITVRMVYGTDESPADQVATYLENSFKKLKGVKLKLIATEKKSRINDYQAKQDFDLSVTRWGPDFADPTTYLNNMEKSQWNSNNYGHYYNATYDSKMAAARKEVDLKKRWNILKECNGILMEDQAIIPIFQKNIAVLQNPNLTGLIDNPVGTPYVYKYLVKK